MKFVLSSHAESQIKERKLSLKHLESVISKPDEIVETSRSGRQIMQKVIGIGGKKFLFRAICMKDPGGLLVITFYRTSKIKKYLGREQ